jgi:hypothetical protein
VVTAALLNLKKLDEVEGEEHYRVDISNRFAALENLDDADVNKAWETIRENVGFEVFTAVVMKSIIFWDMTPCILLSCNLLAC